MYKNICLITPPSLCIEATLHLLRRKKLYDEKSEADFAAQLNDAAEEQKRPLEAPSRCFGCPVRSTQQNGMQVLTVNEKPDDPDQPVLLYFHGGGFLYPPGRLQLRMIGVLAARTGAVAVLPLYPRLPEHTGETALAALSDFYADSPYFSPQRRVCFVGDSAGGGLALSFAMRLRDEGRPLPARMLLLSPWLDLSASSPEIPRLAKKDPVLAHWGLRRLGSLWAGGPDRVTDPRFSPLFGDLAGLPEIAVFTGTHEILYPEARALCEKLAAVGGRFTLFTYAGMNHVFTCYITPEGMLSRAQAARFLRG